MPCINPDCNTHTDTFPYQTNDPTVHFANMGWVGFANIAIANLTPPAGQILRVTSADVNLSQDITLPDVIDGRIDRTVYQLGPKIVEGTLSLPIIADDVAGGCPSSVTSVAGQLLSDLWCWSMARGEQGRLLFPNATVDIRYANHAAFVFDHCLVNTFNLSVTQGDQIALDLGLIGRGRSASPDPSTSPIITDFLAPARVLTWNDITVTGWGGCSNVGPLWFSNQVREFSMEVNNKAERFYTLGGSLFPIDINVGQREITGTVKLMGLNENLRLLAETNQNRFTEKNEIRMGVYIGDDTFSPGVGGGTFNSRDWTGTDAPGNPIWARKLTSVVFRIEEIAMTNEVLETTVNWLALANDQNNYEAIDPCPSTTFPVWE